MMPVRQRGRNRKRLSDGGEHTDDLMPTLTLRQKCMVMLLAVFLTGCLAITHMRDNAINHKLVSEFAPLRRHNIKHSAALTGVSKGLSIAVIDEVIPVYSKWGSGQRMMQLLQALEHLPGRDRAHDITFIARSDYLSLEHLDGLRQLDIHVMIDDHGSALDELKKTKTIDIVFLVLWFWQKCTVPHQYLSRVRSIYPSAKVVVISDDVHSERERLLAQSRACQDAGWPDKCHPPVEGQWGSDAEADVYRAADMVVAITQEDADKMEVMTGGTPPVATVPFRISSFRKYSNRPFHERHGIVFVGNGEAAHNQLAAAWLIDAVWPVARKKLGDVSLHFIGKPPNGGWLANTRHKNDEASSLGIVTVGVVEDLADVLQQYRVFVSPIVPPDASTGVKTKSVLAMECGVALVATPAAVQGLGVSHLTEAWIASDPEYFADGMLALHTDDDLWHSLKMTALYHVGTYSSKDTLINATGALLHSINTIEAAPERVLHASVCT